MYLLLFSSETYLSCYIQIYFMTVTSFTASTGNPLLLVPIILSLDE